MSDSLLLMGIKERLMQYADYKMISITELERKSGIANGLVKKIKNKISTSTQSKILKTFPDINQEWLLNGYGSMIHFPSNASVSTETAAQTHNQSDLTGKSTCKVIRYYDAEESTGQMELGGPGIGTSYQDIILPGFGDCDIALNVWGDSMEPILRNGCIALCKVVSKEYIEFGNAHFIITRQNNRLFRFLKKAKDPGRVVCESANEFYDSFEINIDDILKLYIVKGHIERSAV